MDKVKCWVLERLIEVLQDVLPLEFSNSLVLASVSQDVEDGLSISSHIVLDTGLEDETLHEDQRTWNINVRQRNHTFTSCMDSTILGWNPGLNCLGTLEGMLDMIA